MDVVDFLVLTLAASAIVDVWRNGSLFEVARAYCEAREDGITDDSLPPIDTGSEPQNQYSGGQESIDWAAARLNELLYHTPLWMRLADMIPRFIFELLNCPFCLSHHTPWVLALLCYFPSLCLVQPWAFLVKIPLYSLAATRLGTIVDALVPREAKYNRGEDIIYEELEDGEATAGAKSSAADTTAGAGDVS